MSRWEMEREAHNFARLAAQELCGEFYTPALLLGIRKGTGNCCCCAVLAEMQFTDEEIEAALRNLLASIETRGNPCHVKKV